MVGAAEPLHIESIPVIRVMRFGIWIAADLAGLPGEETAPQGGGEGLVGPDLELVALAPGRLPTVLERAQGGGRAGRVRHWRTSPKTMGARSRAAGSLSA